MQLRISKRTYHAAIDKCDCCKSTGVLLLVDRRGFASIGRFCEECVNKMHATFQGMRCNELLGGKE